VGQDLTDEQAGELSELAAELVARFSLGAAGFCRRHSRPDPRERNLVLLIVMEMALAELFDTRFIGGDPLPLLRQLSANVHGELRSRRSARKAAKGKFDA
jgi:hypothetical protein